MSIKEYVVFKLDNEYYGIDIHNVETIEKIMPMTRVPYTKNFIKGVINLRGNVVPVIDLRKRFDFHEREYDENSRIIISKFEEITVGMIVDSCSEVIQLSENEIEDAPAVKGNNEDNFIKCIGKEKQRIIMIIDILKILDITDMENDL